MPGLIEHLYFDSLIYHSLSARQTTKLLRNGDIKLGSVYRQVINRERFMIAGIMPDFTDDKFKSHFKYINRKLGLFVPDLYLAARALNRSRQDWSVRAGLHAHMYLDQKFLMEFLAPRFSWANEKIIGLRTGEIFTPKEFFSSEGLFGAYAEVATKILDDELLKQRAVDTLPDDFFDVNIPELKTVRPWRPEFERLANNRKEETGKVFAVSEAIEFIKEQAVLLTAQMLYME